MKKTLILIAIMALFVASAMAATDSKQVAVTLDVDPYVTLSVSSDSVVLRAANNAATATDGITVSWYANCEASISSDFVTTIPSYLSGLTLSHTFAGATVGSSAGSLSDTFTATRVGGLLVDDEEATGLATYTITSAP